jgi:uncharacterized protein (TIGR02217 family)
MDFTFFKDQIFPLDLDDSLWITMIHSGQKFESLSGDIFYAPASNPVKRTLRADHIILNDIMVQKLQDFYYAMHASIFMFPVKDPNYHAVNNIQIGAGDGIRKSYAVFTTIAGYIDDNIMPVLSTLIVKINGVTITAYNVQNNIITFTTAPAMGAVITASFEYNRIMRFHNDGVTIAPDNAKKIFYASFMLE